MKYKMFIKRFTAWYITANIILAVFIVLVAPNIVDKIIAGEPLTYADIFEKPTNDDLERVLKLNENVGLTSVNIGECSLESDTVLACYVPSTKETYVTQLGLSLEDIQLICVLNHEARHQWQDENNLIKYDANGNILNREWLESDAYANDGC